MQIIPNLDQMPSNYAGLLAHGERQTPWSHRRKHVVSKHKLVKQTTLIKVLDDERMFWFRLHSFNCRTLSDK